MKKIISLILVFVMLFALCSCDNFDNDNNIENETTDNIEETTQIPDDIATDADTTVGPDPDVDVSVTTDKDTEEVTDTEDISDVITEDAPDTEPVTTDTEKAPDAESDIDDEPDNHVKFTFGKVNGNTYYSDFLGLTMKVPDGWRYYSEEEILQINEFALDCTDEDFAEKIENSAILYDMMATNLYDGASVNVLLEKVSAVQISLINLQSIIESQFDVLKSTMENMGYSDVDVSYQKLIVDGKEFNGLCVSAKLYGLDFKTKSIIFINGNYLVNISASAFGADGADTILSWIDFN